MMLVLSTWTGYVAGGLRLHRIIFDDAPKIPAGDGRQVSHGAFVLRLGERTTENGREAFFEIISGDTVILSVTHRMFVRRGARVIQRLWAVDMSDALRARFADVPLETEEQRDVLKLIDGAAEHLFAA